LWQPPCHGSRRHVAACVWRGRNRPAPYARAQDDLAYEAGVSRSYLSQLEKGPFYASLKIIGRLAEALEVEAAELLRLPHRG
jgi:predicted transcriptional regulator